MELILFVLNKSEFLEEVLSTWEVVGVSGITVLPSTGLGRIRQNGGLRDDIPLIPSLQDFFHHDTEFSHTLFTIVEDDLTGKVIAATEEVVGDLKEPGNGILVVLPIKSTHGYIRQEARTQPD